MFWAFFFCCCLASGTPLGVPFFLTKMENGSKDRTESKCTQETFSEIKCKAGVDVFAKPNIPYESYQEGKGKGDVEEPKKGSCKGDSDEPKIPYEVNHPNLKRVDDTRLLVQKVYHTNLSHNAMNNC